MNPNNEVLVRRWFDEVWNERRTAVIYELLAPEAVSHLESGDLVGAAQFEQYCSEMLAAFPDLRVTVEEILGQGTSVAARWTATGTHEGSAFGLAPTGQIISVRGITWVHIRDGQIVEGWDSWNIGGLMQQLNNR